MASLSTRNTTHGTLAHIRAHMHALHAVSEGADKHGSHEETKNVDDAHLSEAIDEALRQMDKNGDGYISWVEYIVAHSGEHTIPTTTSHP